jgi:hypothetical protein
MKEKRREEVRRGKVIQQRGVQIKTSRYNDRFEWEKKKFLPGSVEFLIRIFGCVPASRCVVRILRFRKHRDARSSSRFFVPLTFFSFSIISYLSTFSTHPPFLNYSTLNMSSGGKSGGKAGGADTKSQSRSAKAGLQFPVGRIHRLLRRGNYAQRIGAGAPVYLSAVLE